MRLVAIVLVLALLPQAGPLPRRSAIALRVRDYVAAHQREIVGELLELVVRGEGDNARISARSASDDKAPIVALLTAADALLSTAVEPSRTTNIKIILNGEEEASSPSLVAAISRYRDKLRADLMVILDGPGRSSGNFDNNQHEENENLRLDAFFDGIVTMSAAIRQ